MADSDQNPSPQGILMLSLLCEPKDTNHFGDISGGWVLSQVDSTATLLASQIAKGRVATVAVESMAFISPVLLGVPIGFFAEVQRIGRTSVRIQVEVWSNHHDPDIATKVTEGELVYVAIDSAGRTREIDQA